MEDLGRPRTNDDDIKLKAALQELVLNLTGNRVEPNVGGSTDLFSLGSHSVLLKIVVEGEEERKQRSIFNFASRVWRVHTGPRHSASVSLRLSTFRLDVHHEPSSAVHKG